MVSLCASHYRLYTCYRGDPPTMYTCVWGKSSAYITYFEGESIPIYALGGAGNRPPFMYFRVESTIYMYLGVGGNPGPLYVLGGGRIHPPTTQSIFLKLVVILLLSLVDILQAVHVVRWDSSIFCSISMSSRSSVQFLQLVRTLSTLCLTVSNAKWPIGTNWVHLEMLGWNS